jgi:hypothetical protein
MLVTLEPILNVQRVNSALEGFISREPIDGRSTRLRTPAGSPRQYFP